MSLFLILCTAVNRINKFLQKFGESDCVSLYTFEGTAVDFTGSNNGTASGVTYREGKNGLGVYSGSAGQVNCGVVNTSSDVVTISLWAKWDGTTGGMLCGFNTYDIYMVSPNFGFNTGVSDLYGMDSAILLNTWRHLVIEFNTGSYGKIWIDGVQQALTQKLASISSRNAVIKNTNFHIFGWGDSTEYRNFGDVDHVRVYNRTLTEEEIQILYNEF